METKLRYKRALAVQNPKSTSAARARKELAELEKLLPVERVLSSRDIEETEAAIVAKADDGDVILSIGGDGLANQVGNVIMRAIARQHDIGKLALVFMRGGYANDAAVMWNGQANITQVLLEGKETTGRPLEITTFPAGDSQLTRHAFSQYGIGGTGQACIGIEHVKASGRNLNRLPLVALGRKATTSLMAIAQYPDFSVSVNGAEEQRASNITLALGDTIAKYGHPHADIAKPEFESFISSPTGVGPALGNMLKMQRSRLPGDMLDFILLSLASDDGQPLAEHLDGEAAQLDSGSTVRARIATDGYNTLSLLH